MNSSIMKRIGFVLALLPASALAQTSVTISAVPDAQGGYWTPERLKAAKPLDLPRITPEAMRFQYEAVNGASPANRAAVPPEIDIGAAAAQQLFVPGPPALEVEPLAYGTSRASYTSTRVFPMLTGSSASLSADRTFPYRAAGKLFFTINGSPYICSASVISRRIVATAGHCVHSGRATGFHSNFVFVPAFRDGAAPLGSWRPRLVRVTTTWASGGGGVPNAADYAMMEMNDQVISGVVRRIGEITGSLGWQTLSLASNHTSKLGYPGNLDGAQKMQNVMSSNFQAISPNTVVYGSDAAGGSSGGPWVQNLEVASVGQNGSNLGSNMIVGISSYGYTDAAIKLSGSSILDSRWSTMYSTMCAARTGNC